MKIQRAYKTELDPNNKQRTFFVRCAGAARFVYNWGLADRIEQYKAGTPTNFYAQTKRFNAEKDTFAPWIREIPYVVTLYAFYNLDRAYKNFFRRVKNGETPGFPKFKSKKRGLGGFTFNSSIHIESQRIKLPKIGWIRLKEGDFLPVGCKPNTATITERAGRWYVSIQVEVETPDPKPSNNPPLGVDVGIKSLAVCSDGKTFENPKGVYKLDRKLSRLQREFSRRKPGSNNRNKTRIKLAACHAKIADTRKHALHQVSHYVTVETKPRVVVIENLNVKGMTKNHHIARAVSDAAIGEMHRQIEYKAGWNGIEVIKADRFYPSSKTCSHCGSVKPVLKLSERLFACSDCGAEIDRDLNAAINLASLAP